MHVFRELAVVTLGLVLLGSRSFADVTPAPQTFQLQNGLRVLLSPVADHPVVHVRVIYPLSPSIEPVDQGGIAHLFEHLMFTSSVAHPRGGIARVLDAIAVDWGAGTYADRTEYHATCIPNHLGDLLQLEAERMAGVTPSSEEFEREKRVVLEEIAWRGHGYVTTDLTKVAVRASYPGHPWSRPVGGTLQSVGALMLEDVRDLAAGLHGPRGATLAVSGPFDRASVRDQIEAWFGEIPSASDELPSLAPLPEAVATGVVLDRTDHSGLHLCLGFRLPHGDGDHFVRRRVLHALFDGDGLRPGSWRNEKEDFFLLRRSYRYFVDKHGTSLYSDAAESQVALALGDFWTDMGARVDSLLSSSHFEEFREGVRDGLRRDMKRADFLNEVACRWLHFGEEVRDPLALDEELASLEAEQIKSWVDTLIRAERTTQAVSHGRDSGRDPVNVKLVFQPPAAAPLDVDAFAWTADELRDFSDRYAVLAPKMDKEELSDGVVLHHVTIAGAGGVAVQASRTFAPLKNEAPGKRAGVAWAYSRLNARKRYLRESDSTIPPVALAYATPVRWVALYSVSADSLETAIGAVMREVLEAPEAKHWRRTQSSLQRQAADWRASSRGRADYARWVALFGERSPLLGRNGLEETAAGKITFPQVVKMHEQLTQKDGMSLVVASGPESWSHRSKWVPFLDGLKGKKPKTVKPSETLGVERVGVVITDHQQNEVEIAMTFPPVKIGEDGLGWVAFELALEVTRVQLKRALREAQGLTYGVAVTPVYVGGAALIEVEFNVRPQNAIRAFSALLEEVERLSGSPLEEGLRLQAQINWQRACLNWWQHPSHAIASVSRMLWFGNPPEEPARSIAEVPEAEVQAALWSLLGAEHAAFSVRGPLAEETLPQFRAGS